MAKLSALTFALLAVVCAAQKPTPKHNLSEEFAKAGIKAVAMLASEVTDVSSVESSIADADANARTNKEQSIVSTLRHLFILRRTNIMINNGETRAFGIGAPPRPMFDDKDEACLRALTTILRARYYTAIPKVCGGK